MTYDQQIRLLRPKRAEAIGTLGVNGHRLVRWDLSGAFTRWEGGLSRPGRSQVGHCACGLAGIEIGIIEPGAGRPDDYRPRLWGTSVPCPTAASKP
jgi:hypothetical protein